MNERDELRGTLSNTICNASNYTRRAQPYLLGSDMSEVLDKTTNAILAAGYRRHRTITTAEDLDALPVGSVIKDRDRDVCQRFRTGWRAMIHEDHNDPWLTDTMEIALPATVLYEPEAQS